MNSLMQAQKGLQALLPSANGGPPVTPPDLEKLRAALIRMAYFGVQGAVPLSATGDSPDKRAALMAQAQSVAKEVTRRLDNVGKLQIADGASPQERHDYHLARIREILGPDFRILPRFTPANGGVLNQAFATVSRFKVMIDSQRLPLFNVLPGSRRGCTADAALMYAETMVDGVGLRFQVGQLPYKQNDRWVALPLHKNPWRPTLPRGPPPDANEH